MPKTRHTDEEAHAFLVQAEKDIQSKQRAQQESKRSVTGVPQTLQEGEMPSLGPDVEKISPDESGEKALSCGKEPDSHMLHSSNKDTNTLALSENQFSQQGGGLLEGSTGNQPVGGGDDGTDDKLGQEAGTQEVMNSVSPLESESQTLNCYLVGVMSMKASAESVLTEAPCTEVAAGLDPEAPGLDLMGQQSGSLEHPHCSTGQNEKGDRQCAVIKEVTAPVKDSAEERGGQGSQDQCKARGELEAEGYTGLKADNQGEGRAGPMGGCGSESEEEQKGKVEKSKEEGGQREKVNKANTLDVGHVHKLEDSKRIDDPLIAQGGDSFKQAGGSKCAQESNFQGGTVKQEEGSKGEAATACQTALGMLVVSKAAKQPQALDADLPGRGYPDSAKESMPSKPPHGVHPQHRVAGNSRSLQAGRTRKRTAKSLEYREPPMPMEKAQTVVMEAIIELSNQADGPVTKIARTDVLAHLTHRELSHDRNVQIALCYYYEPTRFKLGSNSLGTTTQPEGSVGELGKHHQLRLFSFH